jgi:DNA-binding NarL/FixJ family response regulator
VHVSAILRALNVRNRTQVVIELARRGVRLQAPAARAR